MKRKRFAEEQIIGVSREHELGAEDGRSVPQAWSQRSDLLQLEEQVRRPGGVRGEAAEAA